MVETAHTCRGLISLCTPAVTILPAHIAVLPADNLRCPITRLAAIDEDLMLQLAVDLRCPADGAMRYARSHDIALCGLPNPAAGTDIEHIDDRVVHKLILVSTADTDEHAF